MMKINKILSFQDHPKNEDEERKNQKSIFYLINKVFAHCEM